MRRYGRRPSRADELRKKNALKFYEPHLSSETRRQMDGGEIEKVGAPATVNVTESDLTGSKVMEVRCNGEGVVVRTPDESVTLLPGEGYTFSKPGFPDLPIYNIGPNTEQAEQTVTRVSDEMPEFTPEEAARDLDIVIGWDPAGSGDDHSVIAVRTEDGISCHTINTDRIASDSVVTTTRRWRPLSEITPNDGNTVLLWWPPKGPCLGTHSGVATHGPYGNEWGEAWRVVSLDGETFEPSFDELCADGAVFQPIDATS